MKGLGVIDFHGQTLVYEPFNSGWRVTVFGSGEPVGVDEELRLAIEADIAHQRAKGEGCS